MSTATLREMCEKPRRSPAWETGDADVVRFWTDEGNCYGFLFHHLTASHYNAEHKRLFIDWALGTLVIAGPKVLEFYDDFSNHRAAVLKPDGQDITTVVMHMRRRRAQEHDGEEV